MAAKTKRTKASYSKGWETRRRNAALAQPNRSVEGMTANELTEALKACATTAAQDTASDNSRRHSEVDAISRTLDLHRDEQLCGFLGDMSAMRSMGSLRGHYPVMISRAQVEAIEGFLSDHGYGPFGKGSGILASVSTDPVAR